MNLLIILIGLWCVFSLFRKNKKPQPLHKSEWNLYQLIKKKYPRAEYQKKFLWLGKQSFDIYIPGKKIAIEYQGRQHFEPVECFGGNSGYKHQRVLDKMKKFKCRNNKVQLLYFTFDKKMPRKLHGIKVYTDVNKLLRRIKYSWLY